MEEIQSGDCCNGYGRGFLPTTFTENFFLPVFSPPLLFIKVGQQSKQKRRVCPEFVKILQNQQKRNNPESILHKGSMVYYI